MTSPYNRMDPRYTEETSEHLEKQNELLWDAYRSMSHELHKLQELAMGNVVLEENAVYLAKVRYAELPSEEEMLMRKFFEVMLAHGLTKKKEDVNDILDELVKRKNDTLEGSNSKHEQARGSTDEEQ